MLLLLATAAIDSARHIVVAAEAVGRVAPASAAAVLLCGTPTVRQAPERKERQVIP